MWIAWFSPKASAVDGGSIASSSQASLKDTKLICFELEHSSLEMVYVLVVVTQAMTCSSKKPIGQSTDMCSEHTSLPTPYAASSSHDFGKRSKGVGPNCHSLGFGFLLALPLLRLRLRWRLEESCSGNLPSKHRFEVHGKALGQVVQTTVDNPELKRNLISICCIAQGFQRL